MVTYKQAKELVKQRAATKYNGRTLTLLQKLTDSLYRPNDPEGDVEKREVSKKVLTIKGWVGGISDRHLRRILTDIDELHILSRFGGTITYRIAFESLNEVE